MIEDNDLMVWFIMAEVDYDPAAASELINAVKSPTLLGEYLYNKFNDDVKKFASFSSAVLLASGKLTPETILEGLNG